MQVVCWYPELGHLMTTAVDGVDGAEQSRADRIGALLEPRAGLLDGDGFRAHAMCSFGVGPAVA